MLGGYHLAFKGDDVLPETERIFTRNKTQNISLFLCIGRFFSHFNKVSVKKTKAHRWCNGKRACLECGRSWVFVASLLSTQH